MQKEAAFKPGDSCVNQRFSSTHEICKSFDDEFDVRSVFLDISKAFNKVCHEGIILKLKQNGIFGELLNLLFKEQKTESSFKRASFNVDQCQRRSPRGSIYIKDLADELSSNTKLFADDISLIFVVHNRDSSVAELNNDLAKISHWAEQ